MQFRVSLYRRIVGVFVAGVVLIGIVENGPIWTVAFLAAVGPFVCIWFLLLFGPANPLSGNEVSE